MSEPSDHDILIELRKDMQWIKKILGNHLKHHWAIHLATFTALLGLVAVLLLR